MVPRGGVVAAVLSFDDILDTSEVLVASFENFVASRNFQKSDFRRLFHPIIILLSWICSTCLTDITSQSACCHRPIWSIRPHRRWFLVPSLSVQVQGQAPHFLAHPAITATTTGVVISSSQQTHSSMEVSFLDCFQRNFGFSWAGMRSKQKISLVEKGLVGVSLASSRELSRRSVSFC